MRLVSLCRCFISPLSKYIGKFYCYKIHAEDKLDLTFFYGLTKTQIEESKQNKGRKTLHCINNQNGYYIEANSVIGTLVNNYY